MKLYHQNVSLQLESSATISMPQPQIKKKKKKKKDDTKNLEFQRANNKSKHQAMLKPWF